MDLLAELESLAINIAEEDTVSNVDDAVNLEKQAEGHNRESYEYSLTQRRKRDLSRKYDERGLFLIRLAGPLNTPKTIQEAATLNKIPTLIDGVGEYGQAQFCEIDGTTKSRLLSWAAKHHYGFQPTIIRLSKAKKELSTHTQAPMLGKEFAHPQYRQSDIDFEPIPSQDQYPVGYFFYGTLADPAVLSRHLSLTTTPNYVPAYITGGRVRTWAWNYKALVDAPGEVVFGSAFLVQSHAEEDALRFYETDKYEVVRCQITIQSDVIVGLTFRFDGTERDLD